MPTDRFLMHHGQGHTTLLWRHEIAPGCWEWRDIPLGQRRRPRDMIHFEDEDGVPVDDFGFPIDGKFMEPP